MQNLVSPHSNHDVQSLKVLKTVRAALAPKELSYIEEVVFLATWQGKLYREMAHETGYEQGYLKDIGSQLWLNLSEKLGQPVTKKNLKLVLATCADERVAATPQSQPDIPSNKLEFPGSPLAFGSPLYITRSPVDHLAMATVHQAGSLIRIKAPQRMGKTSLINHVMGGARQAGMQTVIVDLRQADTKALGDLDQFLRWFCWVIGQQLDLAPQFDRHWFDSAGSKLSCTTYMQEYFLKQVECPLVIAIDTVHYLVEYPHIAKHFFAMLRSWYEQARVRDDWQKLRLIIAHVAELELPLLSNQSPFNVGLLLQLPSFTSAQVNALAEQYDLHNVGITDLCTLQPLLDLVGGHPYLLQIAFYWLRSGYVSLAQLLQEAFTDAGIYSEHLRRLWLALHQDDTLIAAFRQLLLTSEPLHLIAKTAYRLEGMGLIQLHGVKSSIRCELYRQYFCAHLEVQHG